MVASMARRTSDAKTARKARLQMRALAVAMALVANAVLLAVARVVTGEFPLATAGDDEQRITFPQVIIVTLLVGLVAWGLLEVLERVTGRAANVWLAIAAVVFLISLTGPLANGENTSSKVVLTLLHLGAFASIVPTMWRSAVLRCD